MKNLVIIVLLSSCASFAQEGGNAVPAETDKKVKAETVDDPIEEVTPDEDWTFKNATKIIKTNPFDLLSPTPAISADLEVRMKDPSISLQAGIGLLPHYIQPLSGNIFENQFERMDGYFLRFEPRFHVLRSKNHYFSTEFYLRHLRIADETAIGMEPSSQNPWEANFAYFVNQDMIFHRFNTRLTFKYGYEHIFRNGFTFEFFAGLRINKTNVFSNSKIPEGGVVPWGQNRNMLDWTLNDGHNNFYIMPVTGLKLGLAFNRK